MPWYGTVDATQEPHGAFFREYGTAYKERRMAISRGMQTTSIPYPEESEAPDATDERYKDDNWGDLIKKFRGLFQGFYKSGVTGGYSGECPYQFRNSSYQHKIEAAYDDTEDGTIEFNEVEPHKIDSWEIMFGEDYAEMGHADVWPLVHPDDYTTLTEPPGENWSNIRTVIQRLRYVQKEVLTDGGAGQDGWDNSNLKESDDILEDTNGQVALVGEADSATPGEIQKDIDNFATTENIQRLIAGRNWIVYWDWSWPENTDLRGSGRAQLSPATFQFNDAYLLDASGDLLIPILTSKLNMLCLAAFERKGATGLYPYVWESDIVWRTWTSQYKLWQTRESSDVSLVTLTCDPDQETTGFRLWKSDDTIHEKWGFLELIGALDSLRDFKFGGNYPAYSGLPTWYTGEVDYAAPYDWYDDDENTQRIPAPTEPSPRTERLMNQSIACDFHLGDDEDNRTNICFALICLFGFDKF